MLPRKGKSMVRPLNGLPDRVDVSPHDEITLSSGRHLFNEIVATEKKLVDAISNVRTIYAPSCSEYSD